MGVEVEGVKLLVETTSHFATFFLERRGRKNRQLSTTCVYMNPVSVYSARDRDHCPQSTERNDLPAP